MSGPHVARALRAPRRHAPSAIRGPLPCGPLSNVAGGGRA